MSRATTLWVASVVLFAAVPSHAFAATGEPLAFDPSYVHMAVSLLGLSVAITLLFEALSVRRYAMGGAIAERISYVVLAIVCLAASALAQWTRNFVQGVTLEQIRIASEVLVIVAMALLYVYFSSVRKALQSYLKSMTGSEMLSSEASTNAEEDAR